MLTEKGADVLAHLHILGTEQPHNHIVKFLILFQLFDGLIYVSQH